MRILITDDEMFMCEDLKEAIERVSPGNAYFFADGYNEATDVIESESIDVAFLDVNMPGLSGIELARRIKQISPDTNIIMVTAFEQYALQALKLFVSGYLLKPVIDSELAEVLENLRNPVLEAAKQDKKKVRVRCFGNFEMFYEGEPINFTRQKAKEMLAYLVCLKGAGANRAEICANLFEDQFEDKATVYLRKIVQSLNKDLEKLGLSDMFVHNRNYYAINTDMLDCDYYDYLAGKDNGDGYHGEFMTRYSWAEFYIYELENY